MGIAAVWGVPIVASILKSVLPDAAQSYLPPAAIPSVSTQSVVTALVYGILLAGVLHVLRMVGLRGAKA